MDPVNGLEGRFTMVMDKKEFVNKMKAQVDDLNDRWRIERDKLEAKAQQASDEVPEGQIISTLRKGYQLHDRLLRAANVVVSKGPEAQ